MDIFDNIENRKSSFKSRRDELIKTAVLDINELRKGTQYESRKETAEMLAKRINRNPFLSGKGNDGELAEVMKECRERRNYSKLYILLK